MNRIITFLSISIATFSFGQSFSPAPGNSGTTAIKKDSNCFVGWATGGTIQRGYINISDTTLTASGSNRASFGNLNLALGPATSSTVDIVSLGDSGVAILTFDQLIIDGPGYDFAVFENGFIDHYMELAHVEVSSDGIHYFRFPSTTEIQTTTQLGNASTSDCRMVNNLAGKYKAGYGTPFDINELPNDPNLDKQAIQYVKIIDAIGAISGAHTTTDQYGTVINDPFPTAFESGGFDLEAIGIINGILAIKEIQDLSFSIFPNPSSDWIICKQKGSFKFQVTTVDGKIILEKEGIDELTIDISVLNSGIYLIQVDSNQKTKSIRFEKI